MIGPTAIQALPGRLAVLWPINPEPESIIEVPDVYKRKGEELYGGAHEARRAMVVSSGIRGVSEGDTVGIRVNSACLSLDHSDYPTLVPEGYQIRIYGVTEPLLHKPLPEKLRRKNAKPGATSSDGMDVLIWREA